jgi:hypothetical protein
VKTVVKKVAKPLAKVLVQVVVQVVVAALALEGVPVVQELVEQNVRTVIINTYM